MVPNVEALYLVKKPRNMLDLYARVKDGIEPDSVTELAFEAFRDAADRIMVEAPSAPYVTWYGLIQRRLPGAEEIKL